MESLDAPTTEYFSGVSWGPIWVEAIYDGNWEYPAKSPLILYYALITCDLREAALFVLVVPLYMHFMWKSVLISARIHIIDLYKNVQASLDMRIFTSTRRRALGNVHTGDLLGFALLGAPEIGLGGKMLKER